MALEMFEKMFKEGFRFKTTTEIDVFELHYPDVLATNAEANKAARAVHEKALADERKEFAKNGLVILPTAV